MNNKTLIITNIPSPYRVLQFDELSKIYNGELIVIYFKKIEYNRNWNIPNINHKHIFLNQSFFLKYFLQFDLIKIILKEKPNIIIGAGFSLKVIFVFYLCKILNIKFIVFTDSWLHSVNLLKRYHKIIRKLIIPHANASICVGEKGILFLKKYKAKQGTIFLSPLSIDNANYFKLYKSFKDKKYDIIFSGQFIERKMPFFVIEILKKLSKVINNFKFLLIGSGDLEDEIISRLKEYNIDFDFFGFIQQENLPKYYSNAKILLFPTLDDPWGLVANEACAVGTPVITCNNAGVANDLIIHNYNGFVLPLSIEIWIQYIKLLLNDEDIYNRFSLNSIGAVKKYSIENASLGIYDAIKYVNE